MVALHSAVGGLVVLAFVVVTILNILRVTGRDLPIARTISMIAGALLLIQYILGFLLLGAGFRNSMAHYVIALLAILTVGMEHGYAATRDTSRQRAVAATIATLATTILVLIAYMIGMGGAATTPAMLLP
ncbi:MAG: hypothetical protein IT337_07450 [Thermomicrobiales bacterium]|nr:hypothetical protein [Thermomicrobiales bacterium]